MVRACPVCGSRRWRRDNVTGSAVCEDGHVYQDFRVENQEAEGPSMHALQRRKMKTGKRAPRKEQSGKNEAYYEGEDAEYLRLQALQLLLRTQVQAIRKLWDLPEVYEMIVKDLWTYQLAISALPPPPEDTSGASRSRSQTPLRHPLSSKSASQGLIGRLEADHDKSDSDDKGNDDEAASDRSDKEDDPEVDLELLEEMSRLSELSDKEEGYQPGGRRGARGKKVRKKRRVKVSDTLIVLLLGLYIVRRGTMCVDMENLVNENTIPYLDFAHSTLLPAEMQTHMNRNVMQSLSPIRCPSPKYIFASLRLLARILNTDFGIPIPDVNLPLVSWRIIGGLGGTPVTYSQVTRILDLVDINTSLLESSITQRARRSRGSKRISRRNSTRGPSRTHSRARSTTRKTKSLNNSDIDNEDGDGDDDFEESEDDVGAKLATSLYRRTDRNRDVIMPELAVVAAWVVVMKMSYGLDGSSRRAGDKHDPIVGMPDGKIWVEELETRLRAGALNPSRDRLQNRDYASLAIDDIDRYLNFAEDVLLKDREPPSGSDIITFPLVPSTPVPPPLPPPASFRHFHTALPIHTATPPPLVPGTGIPPEPGDEIRSFDPKDITGPLPRAYDAVIRSGAEMVGVKPAEVAEVVQLIERRLEQVRKVRKISQRGKYGKGRSKTRVGLSGRGGEDMVVEFEVDDDGVEMSAESGIEEDE